MRDDDRIDFEMVEAIATENPLWECRNYDEYGYFVGPKHIANAIDELLEDLC